MNYKQLEQNPHFQAGVKAFKEGKVEKITKGAQWVNRLLTRKQFDNLRNSSYTFLEEVGVGKERRVKAGFLVVSDTMSDNLFPCSDEELRRIDLDRRSKNILPTPFEEL